MTPTSNLLQPHPSVSPGPDAMGWVSLCVCSAPLTRFSPNVLGGHELSWLCLCPQLSCIPLHPFAGWKSLPQCTFHPFTWGPSCHWEVFGI